MGERKTGAIVVNRAKVVAHLPRPTFLQGNEHAGAVRVHTSEMSPLYEIGDTPIIQPGEPVRPGDDVLLVRPRGDGKLDALCRRLLKINDDSIRVRQYDPQRDYNVTFAEWPELWLIVGKYNRRSGG